MSLGSYMDSIGAALLEGQYGKSPSLQHNTLDVPMNNHQEEAKELEEDEPHFRQDISDDEPIMDMSPATVGLWTHFVQNEPTRRV